MTELTHHDGAPTFAVVGHPNKGKSSIVATLARKGSVKIAPRPGTTTTADHFPVGVEGQSLYTLIDTPGFENARRALAWMREHDTSADQRNEVVRRFMREHANDASFRNEVELLGPIVAGAGVLYVVDGSVPYSDEYEAEMEILRWTGQPRMALINPIGQADFIDSWRNALDQYFSIVRVFNAVTAAFDKHVDLLRAFGELRQAWAEPMGRAVKALEQDRADKRLRSARKLAESLADMLTLTESKSLSRDEPSEPHREPLQDALRGKLRQFERRARREVELVYDHAGLEHESNATSEDHELLKGDLFSETAWILFGLQKRHLIVAGVAGGAATGGVVDASVGGASVLFGTLIGALVGGGLGWYSAGRVAKIPTKSRWLGGVLGGKRLTCGPIQNVNFPFVVLGRARLHHALIAGRNHAAQGPIKLRFEEQDAGQLNPLTGEQTRALSRLFAKLGKTHREGEQVQYLVDQLTAAIDPLLKDHPRQ
ncbi:MAG: GTPase/DUF3482 domain-containing protein [Phycisphaeraceae bacterium]